MTSSHRFRLSASAAVLSALLLVPAARAQETNPDLPIPLPPGATVQFEVDARQEDLLGMAKSLVNGLQKSMEGQPKPGAALTASPASGEAAFFQQLLSQDFSKVLKDVNHVHIVGFAAKAGEPLDVDAFYESPWIQAGGRRLAWVNGGPGQRLLIVGFNAPRGFAAVLQSSEKTFAVRADGYPDLEALAPILMAMVRMGAPMVKTATMAGAIPATSRASSAPAMTPKPVPRGR